MVGRSEGLGRTSLQSSSGNATGRRDGDDDQSMVTRLRNGVSSCWGLLVPLPEVNK